MKYAIAILALMAATGCSMERKRPPHQKPEPRPVRVGVVESIDAVTPKPAVIQPPPVLPDEAPPPKPTAGILSADAPPPLTPKDEEVRAALPFAPAIAIDPVDGSKLSIRADTPRVEIKGRVFYFTSPDNMRNFQANPDQYLKGPFARM